MSWIIAETFAFGSNKLLTYKSKGKRRALKEYIKFMLAKTAILAFETIILKISVDFLHFEELIMKLVAMVIVVVSSYIINRYVVFRKSEYISKKQLFKNIKSKIKKKNHNKNISE